jgi:hypothetical protein
LFEGEGNNLAWFICFLSHIEKETVTAQKFAASVEGKY